MVCFYLRFLAESYHCEALCLLGRHEEAAKFHESEISFQSSLGLSHRYPVTLGKSQMTETEEIDATAAMNRGIKLAILGNYFEAQKSVMRALQLIPHCSIAINTLVYILLKTDQRSLALKVLRGSR